MAATFAYSDPTGTRAAANVDRRDRIARHIIENRGSDVRRISRALRLPKHVVVADLAHLITAGRIALGVIAKDGF